MPCSKGEAGTVSFLYLSSLLAKRKDSEGGWIKQAKTKNRKKQFWEAQVFFIVTVIKLRHIHLGKKPWRELGGGGSSHSVFALLVWILTHLTACGWKARCAGSLASCRRRPGEQGLLPKSGCDTRQGVPGTGEGPSHKNRWQWVGRKLTMSLGTLGDQRNCTVILLRRKYQETQKFYLRPPTSSCQCTEADR